MKHSQKRTFMDIEKMSSDEFKAFCRLGNKNHFYQNPKNASSGSSFHNDKQKGADVGIGTEKLYETCSSWCVYFKTRISETAYET